MDNNPSSRGEFESSHPRREKRLAIYHAIFGALIGGALFFLLFSIPLMFLHWPRQEILVAAATVLGAIQGIYTGPLISLRISRYIQTKRYQAGITPTSR